jgi:hypothetical protein
MNRDLFSNLGSHTDLETGRLAIKGSVLWLRPKASVREDSTIRPDIRLPEKRDMRTDFNSRPERHLATYEGEGPHHHIGGQDRSVFDTRGRVDLGQ